MASAGYAFHRRLPESMVERFALKIDWDRLARMARWETRDAAPSGCAEMLERYSRVRRNAKGGASERPESPPTPRSHERARQEVRRGSDVVKAISLGARACMTSRAYLYGLGAGGEGGVDLALELLAADVRRTMALVGARTTSDLTRNAVDG